MPSRIAVFGIALALASANGPRALGQEAPPAPWRILALGDSLTAGYGLKESQSFPSQLAQILARQKIAATVINGGVSGDTTAGGRARLEWMIADKPDAVILELGANDALRGIDPTEAEANLDAILTVLAARNIPVLLAGMLAPPNYGKDYAARFDAIFPALARRHRVVFYPFFLEGVAGERRLLQPDGLHPTAKGARVIAERIAPSVRTLIDTVARRPAGQLPSPPSSAHPIRPR